MGGLACNDYGLRQEGKYETNIKRRRKLKFAPKIWCLIIMWYY